MHASGIIQQAFGKKLRHASKPRFLGKGLSRTAYVASVQTTDSDDELDVVVLLPHDEPAVVGDGGDYIEIVKHEAGVLTALAQVNGKSFRVPKVHALIKDALVVEFVAGMPLDLRATRSMVNEPWKIVGGVAAGLHRLDVDIPGVRGSGSTRRQHVEEILANVRGRLKSAGDVPIIVEKALAFVETHMPPAAPSRLLHGDLLGQNIILPVFESIEPNDRNVRPWLIDFERARFGDPAYDLAIVTRGKRKPFQTPRGDELLLQAYAAASPGIPMGVTRVHVGVHELLLSVRWWHESLTPQPGAHPPETELQIVKSLVDRSRQWT